VAAADYRQITEWVIQGRYPIGIGISADRLVPFRQEGLGFNVLPLQEPISVSTGSGAIHYLNRAPHPNAAQVFVNWLLTRDTQTTLSKATARNSRRTDVPPALPENVLDTSKLDAYLYDDKEGTIPLQQQAIALSRELVK
jgi:hypothetical protein